MNERQGRSTETLLRLAVSWPLVFAACGYFAGGVLWLLSDGWQGVVSFAVTALLDFGPAAVFGLAALLVVRGGTRRKVWQVLFWCGAGLAVSTAAVWVAAARAQGLPYYDSDVVNACALGVYLALVGLWQIRVAGRT